MELTQDIIAKCITCQDFAACPRCSQFDDAAKGKCNRCDWVSHLLTDGRADRMVASPGRNLLDLPTELLLMIVNGTEKSSLTNLLSTCRELRDLTNDAFGAAFFATRHIVFSIVSVDTLLDITKHSVFGRYVKEIAFASDFFRRPFGDNFKRVAYHYTISQAIFSTMSEVFQNVQNNHGSVDLVFYDHLNRFTDAPTRQHLAEVFYDVTRMVEQSGSTLGRVCIAGTNW